jgi:ribosomal protein S18 acetylase RimI-like enzyme
MADLSQLSATLADAFEGDPVWTWLMPKRRSKELLFGALLKHAIPRGHVHTVSGNEAVAMWSPPHGWKLPTSAMIGSAVPMVRAAGLRLPRLLRRLGQIEGLHEQVPAEHWYLEFIGTSKNAQGHGLGSRLLASAPNQGLPVYLESSNPRNLGFYQRHGFAITGEPPMKAGPPQWTLWRD